MFVKVTKSKMVCVMAIRIGVIAAIIKENMHMK